MSIDFKKHLLTQLQSDTVYNLPNVEVINSDIEFALACWKNFSVHSFKEQSVSLESWYGAANWKTNLDKYKEDLNFWTIALEEGRFNYEILLYENFQQDFPIITTHYLKNNEMQREEVFKFRPELLEGVLQNQSKKYGDLTKKLLNEDFNKYISYISMNLLLDEYKTLEDILPIKIDLENYINTYIPKTKLSRKDKNILYLIKLDDDLRVKLNENIGYKINTIIEKPEKISSETFFEFTNKIIVLCNAKEINEEQSELYVKTLRGKLDSLAHKELKLPKEGIFNYLCMLKLNEKLHATLPNKEMKSKNKI